MFTVRAVAGVAGMGAKEYCILGVIGAIGDGITKESVSNSKLCVSTIRAS